MIYEIYLKIILLSYKQFYNLNFPHNLIIKSPPFSHIYIYTYHDLHKSTFILQKRPNYSFHYSIQGLNQVNDQRARRIRNR